MKTAIAIVLLLGVPAILHALEKDNSLPRSAERNFLKQLEGFEAAKTDQGDAVDSARWVSRSARDWTSSRCFGTNIEDLIEGIENQDLWGAE